MTEKRCIFPTLFLLAAIRADDRKDESHWSLASKRKVEEAGTASAGIMISKGPDVDASIRGQRARPIKVGGREGGRGETDSPVPFVCPCTVGGVLRVGLTARIYILPARIFISVRGRVTSSMTGGRDACCLAFLRASLRAALRRLTPRPGVTSFPCQISAFPWK